MKKRGWYAAVGIGVVLVGAAAYWYYLTPQTAPTPAAGGKVPYSALSAEPLSGTAPLTVTFTTDFLGLGPYTVDFGDGTTDETRCEEGIPETDECRRMAQLIHTYIEPGTYTAVYLDAEWDGTRYVDRPKGTAVITVTAQ